MSDSVDGEGREPTADTAYPPVIPVEARVSRPNATRRIWDGRPPIVPGRIVPEDFRALYRDWLSIRNGHAAPFLSALSDAMVAPCRAALAMVEVEAPFRARYLWVGADLVRLYGADPSGCHVDGHYSPRIRREVLAAYERCAMEAEPLYKRRKLFGIIARYGYDRLMLPLTANGQRVDRVLVAIRPTDPRLTDAAQWRADAPAPYGDRTG